MIEELIARLPEAWREIAHVLAAPVAWIPRLHDALIAFFLTSPSPWVGAAKLAFLLFPAAAAVAGIWCTQLALYTLPFRSGRGRFISVMLLAWWDLARSAWMYWVGVVRMAAVAAGWLLSLAHLLVRLAAGVVRQVVGAPFAMTTMMTRSYLQPGVPWIAVAMLVLWCALEAAMFSYTLFPTISEVLADIVGAEEAPRATGPILYAVLLLLILGSFACVQALVDAVRARDARFLAQIALVELFVMFFEVLFLYRELVDSITPWIAHETGVRLGLTGTLLLGAFGWAGIRGMTWFLFGRFGTPPLLAFIARQPIAEAAPAGSGLDFPAVTAWWRPALADFKSEIGWLHQRSDQLLEYLALPVLHLVGAALNFATVLTSGRPVFSLPFRDLKEVTDTRDMLSAMHLPARKQATP